MRNSICRALMAKLDKHGDKYQEAMIPAQWDVCNISTVFCRIHSPPQIDAPPQIFGSHT